MLSKKQKETQMGSEAAVVSQNKEPHLDPSTVLYTLYDRIVRDCNNAQKYLSITDIVGCLEVVKLSIFQATHLAVQEKVSKESGKEVYH